MIEPTETDIGRAVLCRGDLVIADGSMGFLVGIGAGGEALVRFGSVAGDPPTSVAADHLSWLPFREIEV